MRILVLGAGATGGYFGGRLLEAGRDVTFLVRPRRAAELARSGLRIRSRFGDVHVPQPPTVVAEGLRETFPVVLLSAKAYDLENAIESLAPAVGADTAIVPLLNGMHHLDVLDARFGRARVLGGQCVIAATLNEQHEVVHLNDQHAISFGERDGGLSDRVRTLAQEFEGARFGVRAATEILLEMWEKWVFLASLAGGTCLMRAAIGEIMDAPGGADFLGGLLEECRSIAARCGYTPRENSLQRMRQVLTAAGSNFTASMLRDVERHGPIEADHVIGDLIERAGNLSCDRLRLAYTHLKAYEARRRAAASASHGPAGAG